MSRVTQFKPICFINFKIKQPQEFLRKHGFVYTVRCKRKYKGLCRIQFNGEEVAIGIVEEIGNLQQIDLEEYAKYSGFNSADEWWDVIKKIYGRVKKRLYLYRVKVIEWLI